MKKFETLTKKQESQIPVYRDRWLEIGLSIQKADRAKAEEGVNLAYQSAKMTPPKFSLQDRIKNGMLSAKTMQMLNEYLAEHEGNHAEITIRIDNAEKSSASSRQRRYYFGVIVPAYIDYFRGQGQAYDKDQMHDSMMRYVGGFNNPFVNPFTGLPDEGRKSYNDLTMPQAEGYHVLCLKWGAEHGFQIPMPNEVPIEAYETKEAR